MAPIDNKAKCKFCNMVLCYMLLLYSPLFPISTVVAASGRMNFENTKGSAQPVSLYASHNKPRLNFRTTVQKGHNTSVRAVYFSVDESLMLSSDEEGRVRVWDTKSGLLISSWVKKPEYLKLIGFDNSDRVVGYRKGWRYCIDPLNGRIVEKSKADYEKFIPNSSGRNGAYIAAWRKQDQPTANPKDSLSSYSITVWDLLKGQPYAQFGADLGNEFDIYVAANGSHACATWASDETIEVRIFSLPGGRLLSSGRLPEDTINGADNFASAVISPGGEYLVFTLSDNNFAFFDSDSLRLWKTFKIDSLMPLFDLSFSRSGQYCLFQNTIYGDASVWDYRKGKAVLKPNEDKTAWMSPSGHYLVTSPSNPGGTWVRYTGYGLRLDDLVQGKGHSLYGEASWVHDMALSADGRFLAVVEETLIHGEPGRIVKLIDLFESRLVWQSPDLIDLRDFEALNEQDRYSQFNYDSCMLSDDGRRLMVQSTNGAVYVWEFPKASLIYHRFGRSEYVGHAMSPSGRYLALTALPTDADEQYDRKRVLLVDLKSGEAVRSFQLNTVGDIHHTVFSHDERYLACVADNRVDVFLANIAESNLNLKFKSKIVVWDVENANHAVLIEDKERDIFPIGFNRDASHLFCGSRVYRIEDDEPLALSVKLGDLPRDNWGPYGINCGKLAMNTQSPHYALYALHNDGIEFRDTRTHQLKATLFIMRSSLVMVTPDGYFSGDGPFEENVHFVKGREVLPMQPPP